MTMKSGDVSSKAHEVQTYVLGYFPRKPKSQLGLHWQTGGFTQWDLCCR